MSSLKQCACIALNSLAVAVVMAMSSKFTSLLRVPRALFCKRLLWSINQGPATNSWGKSNLYKSTAFQSVFCLANKRQLSTGIAKSIDEILEDAKSGDPDSIAEVGRYHLDNGTDLVTAQKWLKIAADLGHFEAPFLLGVMLIENPNVGTEEEISTLTAEPEDSPASRRAAVLKEIQDATQTARTARKMRIQSKKKKMAAAEGAVEPKLSNYDAGIEYLRISSRQLNGRALCYLGNILLAKDTNDDVAEALLLYEKAANLPLPQRDALFNLGSLYFHGREGVVNADLRRSFEYYRRAAELGDNSSQFWVGYSYATGDNGCRDELNNIAINPALALKYLVPCADEGHGYALYILSTIYRSGLKATDCNDNVIENHLSNIGESKDLFLHYLERAAVLEDGSALHTLGYLYLHINESEDYVPKDEKKGIELLIQSSAAGESEVRYTYNNCVPFLLIMKRILIFVLGCIFLFITLILSISLFSLPLLSSLFLSSPFLSSPLLFFPLFYSPLLFLPHCRHRMP